MKLVLKSRENGQTERLDLKNHFVSVEVDDGGVTSIDEYILGQPAFKEEDQMSFMDFCRVSGMTRTCRLYVENLHVNEYKSTIIGKKHFQQFRTALNAYAKSTGKKFVTKSNEHEELFVKRIK